MRCRKRDGLYEKISEMEEYNNIKYIVSFDIIDYEESVEKVAKQKITKLIEE